MMQVKADMDTILKIYYSTTELSNKEISILFDTKSTSTFAKLKKLARAKMAEKEKLVSSFYTVNTVCAFEAWGIDVERIEKNRAKLMKLGLYEGA